MNLPGVSSSAQFALSENTGVGASGAVYGIFVFLCIASRRDPRYEGLLDNRTVGLFIIWFFACFLLDLTGAMTIGNAAHTAGLAVGVLAAYALPKKSILPRAGLIAFFLLSFVPLLYAPWLVEWLKFKAWDHHQAGREEQAIEFYDRVIEREPDSEWAKGNREAAVWEKEKR